MTLKKWGDGPRKIGNPIFTPAEGAEDRHTQIKNLTVKLDQMQREISRMRKQIHNLQIKS